MSTLSLCTLADRIPASTCMPLTQVFLASNSKTFAAPAARMYRTAPTRDLAAILLPVATLYSCTYGCISIRLLVLYVEGTSRSTCRSIRIVRADLGSYASLRIRPSIRLHPASQPASQPQASHQPASQPASHPASQPASHPASQPPSQPDHSISHSTCS